MPPDLAAEIVKQAVYVSTEITRIEIDRDKQRITAACESDDPSTAREKLERFVASMVRGYRPIESRRAGATRRRDRGAYHPDAHAELCRRRWVIELGQGQVALSGPALAAASVIDETIARIGREQFGAHDVRYPTLIPAEALARCGYVDSFPQNLTMVAHLTEDFDAIEQFRQANMRRESIAIPKVEALSLIKACFCPALCYHCYPTLRGTRLGGGGHVETASGRLARYESSNIKGLDRLWEFSQRSIIWLGGETFCLEHRDRALSAALSLAEEWDIDCSVETANDPFFASIATAKSFWQRSQDLKLEMLPALAPPDSSSYRTVAASSFNLHGTFFGTAFDILDTDDKPACSGCASWGIERWVLVLFTQHGFEPNRWPAALRQSIFS
jgi:seryl-tRNA synthetase